MAGSDYLVRILRAVFGSRNERLLKSYSRTAEAVEALEDSYSHMDADELRRTTDKLKERLTAGESAEEVLPDAFAALREASRRTRQHRHFLCQLIGGKVLYDGRIAEMRTGEGKTIVCHLAAYLKALNGQKVHIVTVNDYLVKRDAEFAQPIFELLGMSVGYIQANVDSSGGEGIRRQAYACNITYGTNSEFGFDYLRDNMKIRLTDQVQGNLDFTIVDEVDSILIDEARTPLIISGPAHDDVSRYKWADHLAKYLVGLQQQANNKTARRLAEWGDSPPEVAQQNPKYEDAVRRFRVDPSMLTEEEAESIGHKQYFVVRRENKSVQITHDGVDAAQEEAGIGSFYVGANMDRPHLIENALRARGVYEKDKEYVVQGGEVIIVDEFTGRLMHGRQWSDGLHQAVEAKEGVRVKEETQTMATITIQNYFKLYDSLAGMTGTAMTESEEFMKIYKLEVVEIPTNRPVNRVDHNDKIYGSVKDKYDAIVDEIHEYHRKGRPNDPFILERVLRALSGVRGLDEQALEKIQAVLSAFRQATDGDTHIVQQMMDAYDTAMGDLVRGRPILVGTTSVENSEKLSNQLQRRYGIQHEVLNAKQHAREAEIVAKAGHTHESTHGDNSPRGNVTIATNMAGRGTDIKLAPQVVYPICKVPDEAAANVLYPVGTTKCCINCQEYDKDTRCAHCYKPKLDPRFPDIGRNVCALNCPCGLHIVGTERHEARRIDNQLRGRAGRQGDPGSSRFFLSLEDDLLKLFMPDWMLRMMEKWGLAEGASLEDKRLTKGIERAQRKVEERNFSIRKSLLEWDEPMDYQRKAFYAERQSILVGEGLGDILWRMIADSVTAAVSRYLDDGFPASCVSEWCRSNLEIHVDPERLMSDNPDELRSIIREKGLSEARDSINTSMGEYIDIDAPPAQWDVNGLLRWSERAFGASMTQNQLRKMEPQEIEEWLQEAAEKHFENIELNGFEPYLESNYGCEQLVDWARSKFEIETKTDDLADRTPAEAESLILEHAQAAYRRREIEYPVEYIISRAFAAGQTDSAYALEMICQWVKAKFDIAWDINALQGKAVKELHAELLQLNESFLTTKRLREQMEKALCAHSDAESLAQWASKRFGPLYQPQRLAEADDPLSVLTDMGKQVLRYEMTRLEQYVLLRIFDQAWKDHLWEMDHLKSAIQQRPIGGDQTHPQSQFAIEGRDLFNQMWGRIRDHVTDRIFKVRLSGPEDAPGSAGASVRLSPVGGPADLQAQHADATGAGFATAAADQAAAMRAQGQPQKAETIRRTKAKVGRNDPCPCGSGKKYKQCHGKGN